MKNILIISYTFLFVLLSCTKNNNKFKYTGTLTGPDLKMNVCSGGIYLKTDNKLYHVEELPGMSKEKLYNLKFPVKLDFNGTATGKCVGLADDGYFTVTNFKF
jgi:hypothetical protein